GAAGGIAAYVLATKGLNVLCLEAGRMLHPGKNFYTHKFAYEWPYRGQGKPGRYGKLPRGMEWKIKEWTDHLYTIPEEDPYAVAPGSAFTWTRLRAVGGRTNLWGRGCDRFGPLDFKPKSLQDGWGEDWPIGYEDVEPYYERVEQLIGVSGSSEGVYNTPSGKRLLPAFNPRCGEMLIRKGAAKLGIKVMPKPLAVLSRLYDGRPPCHYCGACNWGHYLMEHVAFNSIEGFFPELAGRPTTNDDGPGESCLYIPRYNYGHKDQKKYLRGWRLDFYTGCGMSPGPGASLPGFGSAYKKKIKELYPAAVQMGGYGEGLPFFWNYVEIDPGGLRDRFGIPQVRFHTTSEYDHAFAIRDEMYGQMEEILKASGAEIFPYKKQSPYPLGSVTH